MPINYLHGYLVERKLLQTHPLSVLAETRLGIDASQYLSSLLESPNSREPLLAATGGLPLSLTTRVEADLRVLEKHHIKPVFVFPGLHPFKKPRPEVFRDALEACRDRNEAWSKYESGQEDAATRLFEGRTCFQQWDLWRMILRIFRHRNVEFMIAPYFSWAQLIYLQRHTKSYIHAIYGTTETLLYPGVEKLIVGLDLTSSSPSITCVTKRNLLNDINLTEEQFLDVGILVGFDHAPPFPLVSLGEGAIKQTVEMVRYYKTGNLLVSGFSEHPAVKTVGWQENYARGRTMVKFPLILSSEGTVMPLPMGANQINATGSGGPHVLTANDVPADLHEVFTNRLPDEVYYYMSRGLVGPQALIWLTTSQIIEKPPLDNGETNEYRRFVEQVVTEGQTGPRATALALVSSVCHQLWQGKKVMSMFWFDQHPVVAKKPVPYSGQQTIQLADRVAGWKVPYAVVEEELRRQTSSTLDFALCLGATASEKLVKRTTTRANVERITLEKKDEIVANVLWRFLELRGFLQNSHQHSSLGRAMFKANGIARVNDKLQDPLYLFLELVRAGVMHGRLWSRRAFSGGPSFGTDEEKQCMLLVMRVLSIVPLTLKPVPWSAPLSRELLVFNSFVRSLSRALRTLIEVTTLNMMLRSDAKKNRDDYLDVALSLPFQTEVNTGFGVLAKVYLDAVTHFNGGQRIEAGGGDAVREMKGMALDVVDETFVGVRNPRQEVERGFRFWDICLHAIRCMEGEKAVQADLVEQFERAEAWLGPMRPGV